MTAVDIFDLTDEQLDAIVEARRARPDVAANIVANRERDAWQRRVERKAEDKRLAALRRCSRCGIDTTQPDVCLDCFDVQSMDAS